MYFKQRGAMKFLMDHRWSLVVAGTFDIGSLGLRALARKVGGRGGEPPEPVPGGRDSRDTSNPAKLYRMYVYLANIASPIIHILF